MSDDRVLDIILNEIKQVKESVKKLEKEHVDLRIKVYGIALLLGGLGHTVKDMVVNLFIHK